jgi:hypothetical protein
MTYIFDEDIEEGERELRTMPDFYIEPDARCGVCRKQNSSEHPLQWVCSECGEPTHTECGADTEPSGGWDRDYDVNYWVCTTCLERAASAEPATISSNLDDLDIAPF